MTEGKQRLVPHIQILAGEAIRALEGPAAGTLAEKNGHLAQGSRPTDRCTPARTDPPTHYISNGMTGFAAQEPSGQHRLRLLREPIDHQRPAGENNRNDGFMIISGARQNRFRQFALPPGQPDVRAARRLAAHDCGLAQAQQHRIGARADFDSGRDATHILAVDLDAGGMDDLDAGQRAQALQNRHMAGSIGRAPPRPPHLRRRIRQRTNQRNAFDIGRQRQCRIIL